jgi:hypothetical protein
MGQAEWKCLSGLERDFQRVMFRGQGHVSDTEGCKDGRLVIGVENGAPRVVTEAKRAERRAWR